MCAYVWMNEWTPALIAASKAGLCLRVGSASSVIIRKPETYQNDCHAGGRG